MHRITAYRSEHAAKVAAAHLTKRGYKVEGIERMWVVRLKPSRAKSRKVKA